MSTFNKFQPFVANMANGGLNLGTDTLKLFLTNTSPTNTHGTYSQESANEIASGNGYTTGGATITVTSSTQSAGTYTLSANSVVFTASGGSIGPFRYAIAYDSAGSGDLIGWWDYGSSVTIGSGNTFTTTFASGIISNT